MTDMHDVVIVGAGPGGSAAAHYLAKHGLDVLLLDKANFPRDKTCGDGLTPRALDILDDMGLLNELLRTGCRINGMEIVAPRGHSIAAPLPKEGGWPDYALVIPRLILDNAIRERAVASGATFRSPVRVIDIARDAEGVVVAGEQRGQSVTFRGRVAIAATGASVKLLLRTGVLKRMPPMALAARAYYEGVTDLTDRVHLRFDGVPMPGYGWVFPLSASSANVGAGLMPLGRLRQWWVRARRAPFDSFVQHPPIQAMLASARRAGPVKGFPLRMDFASAPTVGERLLLVGEAAGLVNPLTGEGIDYALESGRLAAEHLVRMFAAGDFSRTSFAAYDQLLRRRFQRLFAFCGRVQLLAGSPFALNRAVSAAARHPELKMLLINIGLGNQEAPKGISLQTILKVVAGV
jgi:geranylgeranyl reductase family protein